MLGVNQLDFINYTTALKGNYRKGVHKLEAILANPTHAAEFAANLGGVSVVLGVPIGKEDKNSEALLSLLLASSVADDAVYTWLGQFYEFTSWDDLLGDAGRCQEMMADPFIWRAMASSGVAMGKAVATLAGLDCGAYADMTAVAASQTAMAAVIANSTALNAVVSSSTAMTAVAASSTAMAAVAASSAARTAITNSATAKSALASSPLKTTVTKGNGNSWETRTIRNGMGWLISCYNANSGGEAGSTWYKLDGVQTSQPAGTTNVGKFFTSSLAIYWWSSTSSVTYIPC